MKERSTDKSLKAIPCLNLGWAMIKIMALVLLAMASGCARNNDWIASGVALSRTYRSLRADGARVAWMDEERHGDYADLDIGEIDEFHFLRVATLRVFRSGEVQRWCDICDGDIWVSDK